jgi:hypothetical protein
LPIVFEHGITAHEGFLKPAALKTLPLTTQHIMPSSSGAFALLLRPGVSRVSSRAAAGCVTTGGGRRCTQPASGATLMWQQSSSRCSDLCYNNLHNMCM